MRITGLGFVGTRTGARVEMAEFVRDVLGLVPADVSGVDADLFELPDGSSLAVAPADEPRGERTVGFFVEDLDVAAVELRSAGVDIEDEIATNVEWAPVDGHLP